MPRTFQLGELVEVAGDPDEGFPSCWVPAVVYPGTSRADRVKVQYTDVSRVSAVVDVQAVVLEGSGRQLLAGLVLARRQPLAK